MPTCALFRLGLVITYLVAAIGVARAAPAPDAPITLVQGSQIGENVFDDGDTAAGGHGQTIDGIEGASQEMLKTHYHAHLAIYRQGKQIAVPRGIGIIKPLRVKSGFVEGGKGYYWLHTHDATGIVHIESPNENHYTLANFFHVWGQDLAADNVAGMHGPVAVFVNGRRVFADPGSIVMHPHDQIVLSVGKPNPALRQYVFPEGV